jgi:hypothetical protein
MVFGSTGPRTWREVPDVRHPTSSEPVTNDGTCTQDLKEAAARLQRTIRVTTNYALARIGTSWRYIGLPKIQMTRADPLVHNKTGCVR